MTADFKNTPTTWEFCGGLLGSGGQLGGRVVHTGRWLIIGDYPKYPRTASLGRRWLGAHTSDTFPGGLDGQNPRSICSSLINHLAHITFHLQWDMWKYFPQQSGIHNHHHNHHINTIEHHQLARSPLSARFTLASSPPMTNELVNSFTFTSETCPNIIHNLEFTT